DDEEEDGGCLVCDGAVYAPFQYPTEERFRICNKCGEAVPLTLARAAWSDNPETDGGDCLLRLRTGELVESGSVAIRQAWVTLGMPLVIQGLYVQPEEMQVRLRDIVWCSDRYSHS